MMTVTVEVVKFIVVVVVQHKPQLLFNRCRYMRTCRANVQWTHSHIVCLADLSAIIDEPKFRMVVVHDARAVYRRHS